MIRYIYEIVDSKGKPVDRYYATLSRERARLLKRECERLPLPEDTPPYKILRYKVGSPEVVR